MINFAIILFCLLAGILFSKRHMVPKDSYKGINAWIINVALPAISFTYLPYLHWEASLIYAFIAPIIVFVGSVVFFYLLSKFLSISDRNRITLSLVSGLSNTSFVGFPLIATYYGSEYIEIGILCDQMTFFLLSSIGIWYAVRGNTRSNIKLSTTQILRNIIRFPPFVACILAIILPRFIDFQITKPFFQQLASTVTPLALFSIGLQLRFNLSHQIKYIGFAVFYILILAPLLAWSFAQAFDSKNDVAKISVFEMAMPALVSTSMVLQKYRLNVSLGNSIIGISILIGLASSYFWYLII